MQTHRTSIRWSVVVGTFNPILFVLVFTVLGLMQPLYNIMNQPISDLELGPHGWVQNLNFIVLGICLIAFAFGFYGSIQQFTRVKWVRTSSVLFVLSGTGYIMGGLFTYDPHTKGVHGILHGLGYVLMTLSLVIALLIVGIKFLGLPAFRKAGVYSLITVLVIICISMVKFAPPFQNMTSHIGGLLNRVFLIIAFAWYVVIGTVVRKFG